MCAYGPPDDAQALPTPPERPGRAAALTSTPIPELTNFGPLTIAFDDRVLRPRPWTQLQSEWAAELLPTLPDGPVLEVCAGAGHIGLLAVRDTGRHLVLVDANEVACRYARMNADHAYGRDVVEVRQGAMEDVVTPDERYTLILADPPYIPRHATPQYPRDPLLAIDGGPDGLHLVRASLSLIGRNLHPWGVALLQVADVTQVRSVAADVAVRPELDLEIDEHRVADRGAVVLLRRRRL